PLRLTTISESANATLEEPVRKRIVFAAVCILALPLLFSPFPNDGLTSPSASSVVAVAGHNNMGNFCDCGTPGCICDPGEQPIGQRVPLVSDRNGQSRNQGAPSGSAGRTPGFDLGSSALMLALAFFLWARFRA